MLAARMDFTPERPWPLSKCQPALFYHTMDYPDGTSVGGHWDIRGRFDEYIGRYPIAGKTLLDVGTATGFLAFSAEQAGARVTALDLRDASELRRVPHHGSAYYRDRAGWVRTMNEDHLGPLKAGFWYSWHKFNSRVEVICAPLDRLHAWDRTFDVVLAGAIIEHLSDPVSAIGALARLAKEAVIIAFTNVVDSDELLMRPTEHGMSDPAVEFEWWSLSRGLYRQVFENVGFSVEFTESTAVYAPHENLAKEHVRPTIIARRR
jgi:SAM-dependent methyltransferase